MSTPPTKPRLSSTKLNELIQPYGIDRQKYPLIIVGIRGYYLNSVGKTGKNDIGLYDDALFVVSPNTTSSFNANTDPQVRREGSGFGIKKGMAHLLPGLYYAHTFGSTVASKSMILNR